MLDKPQTQMSNRQQVSVAGCLGYDVLATMSRRPGIAGDVSVAGCLGYDVLVNQFLEGQKYHCFSCWLFRL